MRQIWIAICLATILLVDQAIAADRAQKAEAAESKAGVLEKNAATDGSKKLPSTSEIITKPEAQAVDPVGKEPLNDAITCLSRTIYWEDRGQGVACMEAIANVVMNRLFRFHCGISSFLWSKRPGDYGRYPQLHRHPAHASGQ